MFPKSKVKLEKGFKYIFYLIIIVCASLVSCSDSGEEDNLLSRPESSSLSLNISTATRADDTPMEVIKSLRIILIDESGKVEKNYYTRLNPHPTGPTFNYKHTVLTTPGRKNIYVFANEESVLNIKSQINDISYSYDSLSELFESYNVGRSGFEAEISTVSFTPNFTKPLPMSCSYDLTVEKDKENFTAYLVNAANKIGFVFNNYRSDKVTFTSITLDKVADSEFIMASLPEESKTIDGKYWIDWLKEVAEETNRYPNLDDSDNSNNLINNNWGWITDYAVPVNTNHETINFIPDNEPWVVDESKTQVGEDPIPTECSKGPFYIAESKYQSSNGSQAYTIKLEIRQDDNTVKTFTKSLDYVKSLFRNTNVVISVDISAATENIYVEILKWNYLDPAYGTINPE